MSWLHNFHFTELDLKTLEADSDGGIFYVDTFAIDSAAQNPANELITAQAASIANPLPANLVFHSRPGAPNVLYLNFTGANITNTSWNTSINRSVIPAVAFSTDSDFTTFSKWNTVTGRVYSVLVSTNLAGDFTPVAGAIDLPSAIQSYTNANRTATSAGFYRLQVRKP